MLLLLFFPFLFLIVQIQSCPLTDEYLSRCHCGILTNGESYIKCNENSLEEIPKFKRSFPYDELILINNNIRILTSSSFDNIKTIRRINLYGNSLKFIDKDLLRLLGNYLEELTLTGDNEINSLEFLTRYPLKKLRVLKLNQFNLEDLDLQQLFQNMTKLEILYLQSCQLRQIPQINHLQILNLEANFLSDTIFLSTKSAHLSLVNNQISSIILQNNPYLLTLNLSRNSLKEFYSLTISNKNLTNLDLSYNQLSFLDWSMLNENLTLLNLNSNHFKQIKFTSYPKSLISLDLSSNQLQTLEKNSLFQQLTYFNLKDNPLDCNCHLKWLTNLTSLPLWTCSLSSDFQCQSMVLPRVLTFNITYITTSIQNGLLIEWTLMDTYHTISHLEITLEQMSEKLPVNQTRVFIAKNIQLNKHYHVCLVLIHKHSRDKYCRDVITFNPIVKETTFQEHEILFKETKSDNQLFFLLIGTCLGGILTCILLLTCCYLCYRIHRFKRSTSPPVYEKCSQHFQYPLYHCPHHQIIYNSENISTSTDSSHIDTSLMSTQNNNNNNPKHIYQTIDNPDYYSLKRQQHQIFELWKQSIKHKR